MPYAAGNYRIEYCLKAEGARVLDVFPSTWSAPSLGDFIALAQMGLRTYWRVEGGALRPMHKATSKYSLPELVRVVAENGEEICRWSVDDELMEASKG
jgi:hypothetical protein